MKISELKRDAKMELTGNFKLAVVINLVHLLITFALTYVASLVEGILGAILLIAVLVIMVPLNYGLVASMLKLSRNEMVGITDFIKLGLQNSKKAIFLSLSIFARLLIPTILLIVSAVLPYASLLVDENATTLNPVLTVISLVIMVVALIYIFYKTLSYTLSTYVLIDNPEEKSSGIIKKSCELMKGNKLKYVGLIFSFFGWLLLGGVISAFVGLASELAGSIVSYGISLLLAPYITFSEINFYEDLANISNEVPNEASQE